MAADKGDRFRDKVSVITGAGGDIGRELSVRFARDGATSVVVDINLEAARETGELIGSSGGKSLVLQADVSNTDSVKSMVATIKSELGRIDILVNNAGIGIRSSLLDTNDDMWDLIMRIDAGSVYRCSKYVLPEMIRQGGGKVVNVASLMGMIGMGSPSYSAAKGAIISMTAIVAAEMGPHKINYNTVCPGFIVTRLNRAMLETHIGADIVGKIPMRRFGQTADMYGLVSFLTSDDADYITGAVIPLDGGMGRFLDLGEDYRVYDPFKGLKK
jgi:NAD(P)-dependent dehydrogenase (short-subunit alcohol dehydrogenase family)